MFNNELVRGRLQAFFKPLTDEVVQRTGQKVFAFVQKHFDHFPTWKNTQIRIPFPEFIPVKLDMDSVQDFLENVVSGSAAHVHAYKYGYLCGLLAGTIVITFGYFIWKRRQVME